MFVILADTTYWMNPKFRYVIFWGIVISRFQYFVEFSTLSDLSSFATNRYESGQYCSGYAMLQ